MIRLNKKKWTEVTHKSTARTAPILSLHKDQGRWNSSRLDENSKRCARYYKASKASLGRLSVRLVAARYSPLQAVSWMIFSEL